MEIEIQNSVYLMITNFFYPNDQFECVRTCFFLVPWSRWVLIEYSIFWPLPLYKNSHSQPDIFWKRRVFTPFMTKKYAFTRSLFETLITKTAKTIDWLINQRSNCFLLTIVYEWHTKDKRPERSNVNSMNPALVLRGHVTNASFKHWVGILLMPKIDRAYKNH